MTVWRQRGALTTARLPMKQMKGNFDKISLIKTNNILENLTFWNQIQFMSDTMITSENGGVLTHLCATLIPDHSLKVF